MIAILDYKIGNLTSIQNMFKKIGIQDAVITNDPTIIAKADKLLLPGVGHFDYGMQHLKQSGFLEVVEKRVLVDKTPILGICLGAQLLLQSSEEGNEPGLGWIKGKSKKFQKSELPSNLRIPNMGWTDIVPNQDHPLSEKLEKEARFYFVHSYYMQPELEENILFTSEFGNSFVSGIVKENIMGVQFHPEKSHKFGMQLFQNFANI